MNASTNAMAALMQCAAVIGLMVLALLLAGAVTKCTNWATPTRGNAPEQPAARIPAQRTGGEPR